MDYIESQEAKTHNDDKKIRNTILPGTTLIIWQRIWRQLWDMRSVHSWQQDSWQIISPSGNGNDPKMLHGQTWYHSWPESCFSFLFFPECSECSSALWQNLEHFFWVEILDTVPQDTYDCLAQLPSGYCVIYFIHPGWTIYTAIT